MPVRPKSIVQFEQVYLAVIVLGLVGVAVGWSDMMATVQVQQTVARFGMGMVYIPIVVATAVQLLLWYLVARRGSLVAKWIFVILTGLITAWSVFSLATGGAPATLIGVIDVVLVVLQIIAIVLLFRTDALPWFGEDEIVEA